MNKLAHYRRASEVLPGGVNSSTRFNKALNMPFYVSKGEGSMSLTVFTSSCYVLTT